MNLVSQKQRATTTTATAAMYHFALQSPRCSIRDHFTSYDYKFIRRLVLGSLHGVGNLLVIAASLPYDFSGTAAYHDAQRRETPCDGPSRKK